MYYMVRWRIREKEGDWEWKTEGEIERKSKRESGVGIPIERENTRGKNLVHIIAYTRTNMGRISLISGNPPPHLITPGFDVCHLTISSSRLSFFYVYTCTFPPVRNIIMYTHFYGRAGKLRFHARTKTSNKNINSVKCQIYSNLHRYLFYFFYFLEFC